MTKFYIVRHGQTMLNSSKCFQGGSIDAPLTNEGRQKTLALGNYLRTILFDHVGSSPQLRAITTAELILLVNNSTQTTLTKYNDLKEMEFGDWEGHKVVNHINDQQLFYLKYYPHLYNGHDHDGEDYQDVLTRSKQLFKQLGKKYPAGNILIVSHGIVLSSLINDFKEEASTEYVKKAC